VPYTTPLGADVLLIDKDIVRQIVAALFSGEQVQANAAVVEVQNGSGTAGLDAEVSTYFAEFGFSPDAVTATGDVSASSETEIIDFTGKESTAQRIAALLGLPTSQIRPATAADQATLPNVDIVVRLGADVNGRNFRITTSDSSP
jgi:hypothetical protein